MCVSSTFSKDFRGSTKKRTLVFSGVSLAKKKQWWADHQESLLSTFWVTLLISGFRAFWHARHITMLAPFTFEYPERGVCLEQGLPR